jgi:hypothetical protein
LLLPPRGGLRCTHAISMTDRCSPTSTMWSRRPAMKGSDRVVYLYRCG